MQQLWSLGRLPAANQFGNISNSFSNKSSHFNKITMVENDLILQQNDDIPETFDDFFKFKHSSLPGSLYWYWPSQELNWATNSRNIWATQNHPSITAINNQNMYREFLFPEITNSEINQEIWNLVSSKVRLESCLLRKIIKANSNILTKVRHKVLNKGSAVH